MLSLKLRFCCRMLVKTTDVSNQGYKLLVKTTIMDNTCCTMLAKTTVFISQCSQLLAKTTITKTPCCKLLVNTTLFFPSSAHQKVAHLPNGIKKTYGVPQIAAFGGRPVTTCLSERFVL